MTNSWKHKFNQCMGHDHYLLNLFFVSRMFASNAVFLGGWFWKDMWPSVQNWLHLPCYSSMVWWYQKKSASFTLIADYCTSRLSVYSFVFWPKLVVVPLSWERLCPGIIFFFRTPQKTYLIYTKDSGESQYKWYNLFHCWH